jgi:hypothetical protein
MLRALAHAREHRMLYVTHTAGLCHPVVRCHACDKAVAEVAEALVVYPSSSIEEGQTLRVVIAHRGACLQQMVDSLTNEHGEPQAMPLGEYLSRLTENSEVTC